MFACTAAAVGPSAHIHATPTMAAGKKRPDRPISLGRGVISDIRRANLGFDPRRYHPVQVPSINEIAKTIIALSVKRPNQPIYIAKRDIDSAFRLLRIHPELCKMMAAELPAPHFGREEDSVIFYFTIINVHVLGR